MSEEFEILLKENGVRDIRSAPYHPASNGVAERAMRTFKQAMKNMAGTLHQKRAAFLLSYRTTLHTTTNITPGELFMNRKTRCCETSHDRSYPAEVAAK